MDEDIRFCIGILGSSGGATNRYWQAPYMCTMRDIKATWSADPGDNETITVTNETQSVTLGVLSFGASLAVGAKGTWTADTTNGNTVNASGDVIKFAMTQLTAASVCELIVELDPKCRVP